MYLQLCIASRIAAHGERSRALAAITWLIDAKASIDSRDDQGATALMYACLHDRHGCVEILMRAGADPEPIASALESRRPTGVKRR